ncbi:MAG: DUF4403 family protein [Gemmatimonadaceae bacterium]|nr:DUF4403 family protein [Gemmatimonadaceae bacterium]
MMFHIDVTDRGVAALRLHPQSRLPAVDRKIHASDSARRASSVGTISEQEDSGDSAGSLWLVLAPEQVRLGGLRLEDTATSTSVDVRLFARPLLVNGPQLTRITTTLPPLVPANRVVGDSAHLLLEGLLGYDAASTLLAKQLVGRHFSQAPDAESR